MWPFDVHRKHKQNERSYNTAGLLVAKGFSRHLVDSNTMTSQEAICINSLFKVRISENRYVSSDEWCKQLLVTSWHG